MASNHQIEPSSNGTEPTSLVTINQAIARLQTNIDAIRELESEAIEFDDPRVDAAQKSIRESIREIFGADSPEYNDHSQHKIWHGSQIYLEARGKRQQKFSAGIPHTIEMLEGLITRLQDRRKLVGTKASAPVRNAEAKPATATLMTKATVEKTVELPRRVATGRVCVVHGGDDALKQDVCKYLEKLHLEPVILHKQESNDWNIVEKIDSLPEVDYAVVLLTEDDFIRPDTPVKSAKSHTKRNVLFELGYYIGRIGRSRVCALYTGHDKLPGDYNGISCIAIDKTAVWQRLLGLELRSAGFAINSRAGE